MAVKYMTRIDIPTYDPQLKLRAWEYSVSKASSGDSDPIIMPTNINGCAVTLQITAGSGSVSATTSSFADVVAGSAVWVVWDSGIVTSTTQDYVIPVTALKMTNVSGTTKIILRAS